MACPAAMTMQIVGFDVIPCEHQARESLGRISQRTVGLVASLLQLERSLQSANYRHPQGFVDQSFLTVPICVIGFQ